KPRASTPCPTTTTPNPTGTNGPTLQRSKKDEAAQDAILTSDRESLSILDLKITASGRFPVPERGWTDRPSNLQNAFHHSGFASCSPVPEATKSWVASQRQDRNLKI